MTMPLNVDALFRQSFAVHSGQVEPPDMSPKDFQKLNFWEKRAEQMIPGIVPATEALRSLIPGLDRYFVQGIESHKLEDFCMLTNIKPGHHPDLVEPDLSCVFVQIKGNEAKDGRFDMVIYNGKESIILKRANFRPDQILRILIEDLSDLYNEHPAEAPNIAFKPGPSNHAPR